MLNVCEYHQWKKLAFSKNFISLAIHLKRMTRTFTYFLCAILFFVSDSAFAGTGNKTKGDTLPPNLLSELESGCYEKETTVIQAMSNEQLLRLIDYLFELDSIPADLVEEITGVVKSRTKDLSPVLTPDLVDTTFDYDSLPAMNYYTIWDTKNTTPVFDLLTRSDTSFTLQLTGDSLGKYTQPFSGVVTSNFGWRDSAMHNGIDIDLNKGDPVVAAFGGMVRIAGRNGGYGNVVIIRHWNGLETYYGHLSKIKVKAGQIIKSGQVIGLGGSTGYSTGSHLHFEVRFKGIPINPRYLISFKKEELISNNIILKKTKWGMSAYPLDAKMYSVEKGDTLFEIAKRFGTTTKYLKELNACSGKYMYLRVGSQIRVN